MSPSCEGMDIIFLNEQSTINMVPEDAEVKKHCGPTAKISLKIYSLRKIGSSTVL